MKGLMDRCLNREAALERVRSKLGQTGEELSQLHKWKATMEQKFELFPGPLRQFKLLLHGDLPLV